MVNYSIQQLRNFQKKLKRVKKKNKDEEKWVKAYGFPYYQVSSLGNVRRKQKIYYKKAPYTQKICRNVLKARFLTPLHCGIDGNWLAIRFFVQKNKWKQLSLAKVIVSSFLKIDIEELPHSIFYIDGDTSNVNIENLSFLTDKMRRDI